MVLGLIEVESAFRPYAISGVGARGLMLISVALRLAALLAYFFELVLLKVPAAL